MKLVVDLKKKDANFISNMLILKASYFPTKSKNF